MQELTKCQNHKKDTPPHPPTKDEISTIKAGVAGKIKKEKGKSVMKTTNHLTILPEIGYNPIQQIVPEQVRCKNSSYLNLPEPTCTYLKFILPETYITYLTKVFIINDLYTKR